MAPMTGTIEKVGRPVHAVGSSHRPNLHSRCVWCLACSQVAFLQYQLPLKKKNDAAAD